jgi:prefoldin subunit 5
MNLSRLAAQWERRINDAIGAMRKQAMTYLQEELDTIEALLSKTQGQTEDIQRLISELQAASEYLKTS